MGTWQKGSFLVPEHTSAGDPAEIAVSDAALSTFRALLGVMTGRIRTHSYWDGGLICEDRTSRARPRVWRITGDGALLGASSYNFARGGFTSVPAPLSQGG